MYQKLLLTLQITITSLDGLYQRLEEQMMIREDLTEIKHSILDLVSDLRLTLRIELVKNATLDQAIEVKQQNLVNSQIKCKVVLASNFTTLDGDQTSVYKMNQDNVNGSVRSW